MQEPKTFFTLEELAELVDIPVRTIRYYIAEGLLPGPEGRGKATTYGAEHLLRLRLIRLLSARHMPLAEMAGLLRGLALAEVQTLLSEEEARARELEEAARPAQAREYLATLLKNAQAVRQGPTPTGSPPSAPRPEPPGSRLPAPAPPLTRSLPPGGVREQAREYQPGSVSSSETWERWELAPGVELHVKTEAREQQASLLERIFKSVGLRFRP
jgi:DNA-binding transcriptional MerR regulator